MLDYKFLKIRGALDEVAQALPSPTLHAGALHADVELLALLPSTVARTHTVFPIEFDGETITLASTDPENIALTDRLRFLLAKDVRLIQATREAIVQAIDRHYGPAIPSPAGLTLDVPCPNCGSLIRCGHAVAGRQVRCPSCGKAFTAPAVYSATRSQEEAVASIALDARLEAPPVASSPVNAPRHLGKGLLEFKKGLRGTEDEEDSDFQAYYGDDGGRGMFFYTVAEGRRALMTRLNGSMEVIVGPRRVWRGFSTFVPMVHHVAHPDEFLIVRFRDGRQEHLAGPTELWFDPRVHLQITKEAALQISAKEAVVVYSQTEGASPITRRVVHGPALFVPRPGEWLHTFSWHASRGGHKGVQKEPNALVFQKLWMMPDQMYHDVTDVRTADDAVLTIRLMIFFELTDIERMLEATHDPIGDFVNAATSDVVSITGRYDFEQFKRNTGQLNELEAYRQLANRAAQCGYRINKVVYRGYGSAATLQQMHDQAIEARTRLQLDRATEQQAQDLENYKLDCQLARAAKRRTEQVQEVEHDLALAQTRQEAELRQREAMLASQRESERLEAELHLAIRKDQDQEQRQHLEVLRTMGVDLTAFLTQARADQVIEFRGESRPHVHLDRLNTADGKTKKQT